MCAEYTDSVVSADGITRAAIGAYSCVCVCVCVCILTSGKVRPRRWRCRREAPRSRCHGETLGVDRKRENERPWTFFSTGAALLCHSNCWNDQMIRWLADWQKIHWWLFWSSINPIKEKFNQKWIFSRYPLIPMPTESCPHLLLLFKKKERCNLWLWRSRNVFWGCETSPDFPSAWEWGDNDWISIFCFNLSFESHFEAEKAKYLLITASQVWGFVGFHRLLY